MLHENIVKKKIRNREPILVGGLTVADSNIAELMALCGIDLVILDNEHMTFDDSLLLDCCRAVTMHGKSCVLRTAVKDLDINSRYMQYGFSGLCMTECHGLEDAKRAIEIVKYPPTGKKGLSNECRASEYGLRSGMNTEQYMKWSNDNTLIIVTLEDMDGIKDAEAICALPDIDMVHVGPVDLSASMGLGGNTRVPEIRTVLSETFHKLDDMGNYNAYFADSPSDIPRLVEKGALCIFVPTDIHILRDAFSEYGNAMKRVCTET